MNTFASHLSRVTVAGFSRDPGDDEIGQSAFTTIFVSQLAIQSRKKKYKTLCHTHMGFWICVNKKADVLQEAVYCCNADIYPTVVKADHKNNKVQQAQYKQSIVNSKECVLQQRLALICNIYFLVCFWLR